MVDNARTNFVVLIAGDDHLWEGVKGGKDGPASPHSVSRPWRSDNLDLHQLFSYRRKGRVWLVLQHARLASFKVK